jgi:trk system potassium uptake protein TrkA
MKTIWLYVSCAKKRFHIKKAVALLTDPKKTDFFYKMGIDSVVCAITAITGIIEQQALIDKIATLVPIGEGRVSIAEVPISSDSPAADKKLWEINLPKQVIVGCILRGDAAMIPRR